MIFVFLVLIALATRSVGDLRPIQYSILEAIAFGWLWLRQEPWFEGRPFLNKILLAVSAVAAIGVYTQGAILVRLAILVGVAWLLRRGPVEKRRAHADWALQSLAVYAIAYVVLFEWPLTFNFVRKFSYWYSGLFDMLAPPGLELGPSAAGWAILVAGMVFLCVLQFRSKRATWGNTLAGLVLLLIGQVIFWALAFSLATWVSRYVPLTQAVYIHLSVVYLLWTLLVVRLMAWLHPPESLPVPESLSLPRAVPYTLAGFAVLAILFGSPLLTPHQQGEGKRILILNADKLDSMTPNFTRFGDRSGGMFGMLPRYCRALGYEVREANVTPEIFDSVDVCIFANLIDSLPRWQRDSVISFVRQGGGLLALADHTGHTAIRGPTNDITEPLGLSLEFDTAVPLRRAWYGQMRFLPHRIAQAADEHADVEVWLGASVDPLLGSLPVVIGTYAYSDPGDTANADRSFLGNLSYDAGEPLGDVAIAAVSYYGKGRAALFGDTSPFQNGALVMSHRLAARTLAWLSAGGLPIWDHVRIWGFPLIMLGALVIVLLTAGDRLLGIFYLALLPVVSISLWNVFPAGEPDQWHAEDMKLAYIDDTHGQVFDLMGWERYSVGGLEFNLMRNGYQPQIIQRWDPDLMEKADLVVLARPTQEITRNEISDLRAFMKRGGWVLLTAGYEEHDAVEELLDSFGLRIENIPLGRATGIGLRESPQFARAYQVTSHNADSEVICAASNLPVIQKVHHGDGGMVVIGDPVFLFNDNLENRGDDYHLENIRFVHELIKVTAGTGGDVEGFSQ